MQARKLAKALNAATFAAAAWGWLFPHPLVLVVAVIAILPWVAVLLMIQSPGHYRILSRRKDAHYGLEALSLLPGLTLASVAILYVHVMEWR